MAKDPNQGFFIGGVGGVWWSGKGAKAGAHDNEGWEGESEQ